jgi:hypothetical protein
LKEKTMRKILTHTALVLALALGVATPAALAKGKKKYSPEHFAATKKCREDYRAAVKAANSLKGKEKRDALAAARTAENQCMANAPK